MPLPVPLPEEAVAAPVSEEDEADDVLVATRASAATVPENEGRRTVADAAAVAIGSVTVPSGRSASSSPSARAPPYPAPKSATSATTVGRTSRRERVTAQDRRARTQAPTLPALSRMRT